MQGSTSLWGHGQHTDPAEWQKLQDVERHLGRLTDARKMADWKSALRKPTQQLLLERTLPIALCIESEALLRLHRLEEADSTLSSSPKLESSLPSSSRIPSSLVCCGSREGQADRSCKHGSGNGGEQCEIGSKSASPGNELFKSANFEEAFIAYGEGLKYEPSNSVLYCNRAACWSKLGQWEKSVADCNEALRFQPNYTKALLRRADSNAKLERWVECVRDYEYSERSFQFGGEVEEVTSVEQFQAATSVPGVSVVFHGYFEPTVLPGDPIREHTLQAYPSANFLKVDINESPLVANAENVRIVPTFKIYKNGMRMKEMICPNQQVLEYSVRHYSL
uniref:Thioredoxin domain-containing protein n=1 Tax=Ananas comosus var. bracteatus TaxID=296719 RepID=A0A6V7NZN2_ANACO|nr:unnamed protein product [Ananas comosus var. bracteatus]